MAYWIDLFTGITWNEFRKAGSQITGFRKSVQKRASRVKKGDIFLCYLTGVKRWVGALKVLGPSNDMSPIWKDDAFPVRFRVEPIVQLDPVHGIELETLEGQMAFYRGPEDRGKYLGFLRSSPRLFTRQSDGDLILRLLKDAEKNPKYKPVDPKKLERKPTYKVTRKTGKNQVKMVVSVPEPEETYVQPQQDSPIALTTPATATTSDTEHTQMQRHLVKLGIDMGLNVWIPKNDRQKVFSNGLEDGLHGVITDLPKQFNEATTRTIEFIDVLWLKGKSIIAAFEVEATTSVASGLLRMSDLLALQPNLDIKLYIVAPDDRRNKVEQEILRPTFAILEKPLPAVCGFIPFTKLTKYTESIKDLGLASSLKPEFLTQVAEYFG